MTIVRCDHKEKVKANLSNGELVVRGLHLNADLVEIGRFKENGLHDWEMFRRR